jgi:hypothetical protein
VIRYQVAPDSTLSLRGEFFPPGAFVPTFLASQEELDQLVREGTLLKQEKRKVKGRKKRRTAVTRFCLDPDPLRELSLAKLRILVQERGVKPPETAEECILLLSKDYRGD